MFQGLSILDAISCLVKKTVVHFCHLNSRVYFLAITMKLIPCFNAQGFDSYVNGD